MKQFSNEVNNVAQQRIQQILDQGEQKIEKIAPKIIRGISWLVGFFVSWLLKTICLKIFDLILKFKLIRENQNKTE